MCVCLFSVCVCVCALCVCVYSTCVCVYSVCVCVYSVCVCVCVYTLCVCVCVCVCACVHLSKLDSSRLQAAVCAPQRSANKDCIISLPHHRAVEIQALVIQLKKKSL